MGADNYSQIIKDCFWDYNVTQNDLYLMFISSNMRDKNILFEKILSNSTKLLRDMKLFDKEDLTYLIDHYKIPRFNSDYIARRKNIVEYCLLDRELLIEELKWKL